MGPSGSSSGTSFKLGDVPSVTKSGLFTGAGTPWGPGSNIGNLAQEGNNSAKRMLQNEIPYGGTGIGMALNMPSEAEGLRGSMVQENDSYDRINRKKAEEEEAGRNLPIQQAQQRQAAQASAQQAALDKSNAAGAESATNQSNIESSVMQALAKRRQGTQMFGGY